MRAKQQGHSGDIKKQTLLRLPHDVRKWIAVEAARAEKSKSQFVTDIVRALRKKAA